MVRALEVHRDCPRCEVGPVRWHTILEACGSSWVESGHGRGRDMAERVVCVSKDKSVGVTIVASDLKEQ